MKKKYLFLILVILIYVPFGSYSQTAKNDTVYDFVTTMPQYLGGQKGMLTYFVENMRYPLAAYLNGISATAYVNFIVETDGTVSDVTVLKPIGYGCDQEAIRLVRLMKDWKPGEIDGKKVRVRSNTPVYFKEELYTDSRIYTDLDTMPEFPGGSIELITYIESEVVYSDLARKANINGVVNVDFVIEKDGSVSNVTVNNNLGYGCDEAAAKVVLRMPLWEPGYYLGEPARTLLSVPVPFKSSYKIVENMPEFPGGRNAMYDFLRQNLEYPEMALEQKIEGQVVVSFIVEADGSLSKIELAKGIGSGCDEEALRLISIMPAWIPGMHHGKPVAVEYNIAVGFKLPE
ncbi:MAG: energy transducer TonB [Bacteroidales bacterium]|jgi:TonB family protein|nr:energy transducer TonB [Bacteroidales bacterium]